MNKKVFIYIFLITIAIFSFSCSDKTETTVSVTKSCNKELINEGIKFIIKGDGKSASSSFYKAIKDNENCGDAHWGLILSKIQEIDYNLNALIFMNNDSSMSPESFKTMAGIQTIINGVIGNFEVKLRKIADETEIVLDKNYELTIPDYPLFIGNIKDPYIDLSFQGKLGIVEAEGIKSSVNAILGSIDFIMAHDFDISMSIFPMPTSTDSDYNYYFYVRDAIPSIYEFYPNFLGKGYMWEKRSPKIDNEFANTMTGAINFLINLPNADNKPGINSSIILYEDTDNNGIDGGDVIGLNIKEVRKFSIPVSGFSTPDDNPEFYKEVLSHFSIPYFFTTEVMKEINKILNQLYISMYAVDNGGMGAEIHPYTLFNALIDGIGFIDINEIPDFLAIKPTNYFLPLKPLKDYLPNLIDFPGGFSTKDDTKYSFLIELESKEVITGINLTMYSVGDSQHFTDTYKLDSNSLTISSIEKDCIVNNPYGYYPAWQDPGFNQTLLFNLTNLFAGCSNDTSGWNIANNYSLDKIINGLGEELTKKTPDNLPNP